MNPDIWQVATVLAAAWLGVMALACMSAVSVVLLDSFEDWRADIAERELRQKLYEMEHKPRLTP